MKKILSLIGARPQIIKEAILGKKAREAGLWEHIVVHSGQHYDAALSDVFFADLGIPEPRYNLGIGSASHANMTAQALIKMEDLFLKEKPDALLVYGDTNTTLAGALAAAKLHIPVIHVEAGIRMLPKTMPEEINRVLTDAISSLHLCCSKTELEDLKKENIHSCIVTGDIMYDLFLHMKPHFNMDDICKKYNLKSNNFIIVTLHRDYNVDNPAIFSNILNGLQSLAEQIPVLFFIHPRTKARIKEFDLEEKIKSFYLTEPQAYVPLMSLVEACAFVITDSGGLQKEAYYAGKRAVVVMPDTGWRALTECGWNILAAGSLPNLPEIFISMLDNHSPALIPRLYGDGNAAGRIVQVVNNFLNR